MSSMQLELRQHLAKNKRPVSARLPRSLGSENIPCNVLTSRKSPTPRSRVQSAHPRAALGDITNRDQAQDENGKLPKSMNLSKATSRVVPTTRRASPQATFRPVSRVRRPALHATKTCGVSQVPHFRDTVFSQRRSQATLSIATGDPPIARAEAVVPVSMSHSLAGMTSRDSDQFGTFSEYGADVLALNLKSESNCLPPADCMEFQTEINMKMRAILVDWLVEVHFKYRMRSEVLHLTVSIIDRYLMRMPVQRRRLQLVGVAAMCIAAKYEEINPPPIDDYVFVTDNSYTNSDVIAMECQILSTLEFEVAAPTAAHVIGPLLHLNKCDDSHNAFVNYLAELALVRRLHFPPSQLVCAAILFSNELDGREPWPAILQQITGYFEEQLMDCAQELRVLLKNAPIEHLQAICVKYQSATHHHVANGWPTN